jgi:hypothetical protein
MPLLAIGNALLFRSDTTAGTINPTPFQKQDNGTTKY